MLAVLGLLLASPGGVLLSQTDDSQYFTPNFVGVDVQEVIRIVANETGRSFIVDARVKGPVTFFGARMPREALYEAFLAMLQVNGFVAIPAGNGVIKVLPDTNARQMPALDLPSGLDSSSDEIVTQVIQVQNVGAAQLVPILRPLVPQYGHLAAHPASNMLIISDREANVYRLARIIERIDRSSDEDIEVIPLQHASAGDLVRVLNALNQASARTAEGAASPVVLTADERTNSVLVAGERSERLRFRTLVAHLDTPLESGGNTQVIYLRYADAEELAGKLTEQVNQQAQQQGQSPGGAAAGGGGGSPAQRGGVIIWADPATNALVITAPPKVMRSLQAVIDQLDIRRAQVQLDAIIVDISADRSAELGLSWILDATSDAASAGATNFRSSNNSIVDVAGVVAGAGSGGIPPDAAGLVQDGLTFGLGRIREGSTSFAVLLRALEGDARTNILSKPSITTLDNEEAELSVGQQVPFLTGSFSNVGGGTGTVNPFQTIQRQDVGLNLKVTPQINEGNAVILDIELEVSSLSQGSAGAVDLITNRRTITQKVLVEDGGVVVLGGLIDETLTDCEQRVPGLGRVPVIKNLFRARTAEKNKRNLMVFVQPRILRDARDAALATNEKYSYMRELQLQDRRGRLLRDEAPPLVPEIIDLRGTGSSGSGTGEADAGANPDGTR